MEITLTLRKNGGYKTSGLGSRLLFPVVTLTGRPMGILLFKKILKSCNSPSNLFLECLNRFLALLTLYQLIDLCFSSGYYYKKVVFFQHIFFRSHSFSSQSLLLSTTILNDTKVTYLTSRGIMIFTV